MLVHFFGTYDIQWLESDKKVSPFERDLALYGGNLGLQLGWQIGRQLGQPGRQRQGTAEGLGGWPAARR